MTDRALLQVALHALEKHALTKEEKLIALINCGVIAVNCLGFGSSGQIVIV